MTTRLAYWLLMLALAACWLVLHLCAPPRPWWADCHCASCVKYTGNSEPVTVVPAAQAGSSSLPCPPLSGPTADGEGDLVGVVR